MKLAAFFIAEAVQFDMVSNPKIIGAGVSRIAVHDGIHRQEALVVYGCAMKDTGDPDGPYVASIKFTLDVDPGNPQAMSGFFDFPPGSDVGHLMIPLTLNRVGTPGMYLFQLSVGHAPSHALMVTGTWPLRVREVPPKL
jgi:hypothetical protein